MGKLLSFSSLQRCRKPAPLQSAEPNQYVRQSYVNQFACGKGVTALARQNKCQMRQIENAIREALWKGGHRVAA